MDGYLEEISVLHVDDDPDFADMAATFLEREDDRFHVETAVDAEEGLARLDTTDFDCIVSDFDMPDTDGLEFLRAVRKDYPKLPFILFTGKGSEEIASDAISAGVTDYLQKGGGTDQYTLLANRINNAIEQYQSRQALEERNQELRQFEAMVNSMHEAACIYDAEGRFEVVNEYLAEWYDVAPAELEGTQSNLIPRIRELAESDPVKGILSGQRSEVTGEIEAEFPGHGFAVLEYRLTPLFMGETIEGIVGVARDITRRKEREQNLRGYKNRLELATEVGEIGIWELDLRTLESPVRTRQHDVIFGYDEPVEDWTLERFFEHVLPEHRDRVERSFREGLETGVWSFECPIDRVDGEERWITARGRVINDERGQPERALGVVQDITDRKRRESQLETQNRHLEEFTRIVSHDLKSPLAVAQGRLELAREEHDGEDLEAVARAHERMNVLIEDLLSLAREGEEIRDTEAVSLDDVATECWETIDNANARLQVSSGIRLEADRSRLKQLIENLVRNAIEHGGENVTISIGALETGFYLEDDGPGIPEDIRDDVFSAGFTTSERSTGYGLSIVKNVVDAHGWNLEITDGTEGGARFEITGVELAD